ncbi:MAG: hypothetical protein AAFN79_04800 [Pseudomonadota bacterium]
MFDADYTPPPSTRQLHFAREIAARTGKGLPDEVKADRRALSAWISRHRSEFEERRRANTGAAGATAKQIAFAEKISRARRRAIPAECFRSAALMSRWIDANR